MNRSSAIRDVVQNSSVSAALAQHLATSRFEDLPEQVVAEVERAVLDWYGSVLAGASEPPARIAQSVAASLGSSDEATVFGAGRGSAAAAALSNGVASHMLEYDDVHKGSTLHAAAPVISAALAVAEREHAPGERFLLGVVLGYDAALRIGEAVNPSHYRYWHPTGTAATFGAAAAVGSLLGLDASAMLHALGSAGTQAAGLWEFNADGAMSKHLHPGKAAMNGILAADLARRGFTGASRILEGNRGFFRATSEGHDEGRITDALGTHWKILENCYKLHACCGHTHSAIDVALELRAEHAWQAAADVLASVAHVDIETYGPGYEIVKESNPRTPYQAKFSLGYVVAAALTDGVVGLQQFDPSRFGSAGVQDARVAGLLTRTQVRVADDLTSRYPAAWPTRLTVRLVDGTIWRGTADFPRGNPERPASTATLEEKFLELVGPRVGATRARSALERVRSLRKCRDMDRYLAPDG